MRGILKAGNEELGVLRPVEDMEVKDSAVRSGLHRASAPRQALEGARGGAADGIAVRFHPYADLFEALDGGGGDQALGGRADIEQVVAAFAGDVHQVADERLGALPVVVVTLVAPGVVHGHAGLPIAAREAGRRDVLLWGLRVTFVAAAQAVVVDDTGLELEQGQEFVRAFLVHVHGRVPPEHGGKLAVVGEDFLYLRRGDLGDVVVHTPFLGRVPLAAGG